ncbi:MAG: HAMP domain-containing histidine kinase [Deltaproteobacteria bacterium]|nr:HAMP domain-containing histidine kinase [Deltaproteobacteria bacterium]
MTAPTIEQVYAEETVRLAASRLPALAVVFAALMAAAWLPESLVHPERVTLYAGLFGVQLLGCVGAVMLTRSNWGRGYSPAIVACTSIWLCSVMGVYHAALHGEAELLALALAGMVTGVGVLVPLGVRGQLPVALGAIGTYGIAAVAGARSSTSIALTALGVAAIGGLSVAGAAVLDRYRYASFRRTEQLRRANAALAQANEAKNLFLANVSHELRSPLNVILGYAQLMLDDSFGPLPPDLRQPLERVVASTQSLVYLISDLLDLSRIEAGRLAVSLKPVELAPLFAELESFILPALVAKPVRFVAEEAGTLAVTADPDRLRQVLVNLLTNAAKFTPSGEIRLRAVADGDGVGIEVTDTGIGIAAEDLPHIFEPFYRGAGTKQYGGVGIGLSISARLARAMGGELIAHSRLNEGSRFTVRLPAAAVNC